MKAVCIVGMTNSFYSKAGCIINSVAGTLGELGLSVSQINLLDCMLPYHEEGMVSESFTKLALSMRDVKNIIFAYNATHGSPSAVMKVFLEYLCAAENRSLIEDKYIFNIVVSDSFGEKEAAEYLSGVTERLGGFELTRVCIGGSALNRILDGSFPLSQIEKYAEDYYRLIRQNRVFLRSSAYGGEHTASHAAASDGFNILRNQVESSIQTTKQNSIYNTGGKNAGDMRAKSDAFPGEAFKQKKSTLDFDAFNSRQEEDIEELTKLFSGKIKSEDTAASKAFGGLGYGLEPQTQHPVQPSHTAQEFVRPISRKQQPNISPNNFTEQFQREFQQPRQQSQGYMPQEGLPDMIKLVQDDTKQSVVPRNKTCKQMTQSLPHYFQSQLAQDTEAIFQFYISGEEDFAGYLVIRNKENDYYDGQYDSADITIISPSNVWQDVLKGKLTAQKAFMSGQLKVRGNFMLLNRFDQLYKKMS